MIIGEEGGGPGKEIYDSVLGDICMAPGRLRIDGVDGFGALLVRMAAERRENDGVKLSNIRGCLPLGLWDQRLTWL